jgi:hypothetical protein
MGETEQAPAEEGSFRRQQDAEGVRYETIEKPAATGVAYVDTPKAKYRRDKEMEAGKKRVAEAAELNAKRPPVIKSEAERRAEGYNTSVFRPNSLHADRTIKFNGVPVSQGLGALMRRVGSAKQEPVSNG